MKEEILKYALEHWGIDLSRVLDMGCGNGIMTKLLVKYGAGEIAAADASASAVERYVAATGRPCMTHSFEDIAEGRFPVRRYSLVVCSFSLHFLQPVYLPLFMAGLRRLTQTLLVIGPTDRPTIPLQNQWVLAGEHQTKNEARGRLFRTKTLVA